MGHGLPDGALSGKSQTIFSLGDLSELAARFGSPLTFDRRGNVLLAEDFRNGTGPFYTSYNGDGGSVELSTRHTRQGSYSMKMVPGSNGLKEAALRADLAYPVLSGLGLEFTFSLEAFTDRISGALWWDDGTILWKAQVEYDLPNTRLEVYDRVAGMTPFASGVILSQLDQPSNTLKFVVDALTGKYVRCILNHVSYDLSAYEVRRVGSTDRATLRAYVYHYAVALKNPVAYVDNVIVTQNEP